MQPSRHKLDYQFHHPHLPAEHNPKPTIVSFLQFYSALCSEYTQCLVVARSVSVLPVGVGPHRWACYSVCWAASPKLVLCQCQTLFWEVLDNYCVSYHMSKMWNRSELVCKGNTQNHSCRVVESIHGRMSPSRCGLGV